LKNAKVIELEQTVNKLIENYKRSGTIPDDEVRIATLAEIQKKLQAIKLDIQVKIKDAAYSDKATTLEAILQKILDNEHTYVSGRDRVTSDDERLGYVELNADDEYSDTLRVDGQHGGSNLKTSSLKIDDTITQPDKKKEAIKVKTGVVDALIKALKNLKSNAANTNGIEGLNEIKTSVTTINVILKEWENELSSSKVGGDGQGHGSDGQGHGSDDANGQGHGQGNGPYMQSGGAVYTHFTDDIGKNFVTMDAKIKQMASSFTTDPIQIRMWKSIELNFNKYTEKKKALETAAKDDVDETKGNDIIALEEAVKTKTKELEAAKKTAAATPAATPAAAPDPAAVTAAETDLKTAEEALKTENDKLANPSAPDASATKGDEIQIKRIKLAIAELRTAGETLVKSIDVLIRTLGGTVEKPKENLAKLLADKRNKGVQPTAAKPAASPNLMQQLAALKQEVEDLRNQLGKTDKIGDNESAIRAIMMGQDAIAHKIKFLVDIPKWQQFKVIEEGVNTTEEQVLGKILDSLKTEIDDLMKEVKSTETERAALQAELKTKLEEIINAAEKPDKDGKRIIQSLTLNDVIKKNNAIIVILQSLLDKLINIKTKRDTLINKVFKKTNESSSASSSGAKVGGGGKCQVGGEGCNEFKIKVKDIKDPVTAYGKFNTADAQGTVFNKIDITILTNSPETRMEEETLIEMYISEKSENIVSNFIPRNRRISKEGFKSMISEIIKQKQLVAFKNKADCDTYLNEVSSGKMTGTALVSNPRNNPIRKKQISVSAFGLTSASASNQSITPDLNAAPDSVLNANADPALNAAPKLPPPSASNPPPGSASDPTLTSVTTSNQSQSPPIDPGHPITGDTYKPLTVNVNNIDGAILEVETKKKAIEAENVLIQAQLDKASSGNSSTSGNSSSNPAAKSGTNPGGGGSSCTRTKQRRRGDKKSTRRKRKIYRGGVLSEAEEIQLTNITNQLAAAAAANKILPIQTMLETEKKALEEKKAIPGIGEAALKFVPFSGVAKNAADLLKAAKEEVNEIDEGPKNTEETDTPVVVDQNAEGVDPNAQVTDPNAQVTDPNAQVTDPNAQVTDQTEGANVVAASDVNKNQTPEEIAATEAAKVAEKQIADAENTAKAEEKFNKLLNDSNTVIVGPQPSDEKGASGTGDGPDANVVEGSTSPTGEENKDKEDNLPLILEKLKKIGIAEDEGTLKTALGVNLANKTYKEFNDFIQTKDKETDLQKIFEEFNKGASEEGEAAPGEGEAVTNEGEAAPGKEENPDEVVPVPEEENTYEEEEKTGEVVPGTGEEEAEEGTGKGGSKKRRKTKRKSAKRSSAKHSSAKRSGSKRSRSKRSRSKRSTTNSAKHSSAKHSSAKRSTTNSAKRSTTNSAKRSRSKTKKA